MVRTEWGEQMKQADQKIPKKIKQHKERGFERRRRKLV
jgi:hypothetical protein